MNLVLINKGDGKIWLAVTLTNWGALHVQDMMAEARLLRQHKGRLEARMQILEEHNRQLEAQLQRLRKLLEEVTMILFLFIFFYY